MTAETPSIVRVEALLTFDRDMPGQDLESGEAVLRNQSFVHFDVPATDGEISEATTLFALLSQLSARERQHLAKVSLCLFLSEEQGAQMAPWLDTPDSPLHNGKLWLKQHLFKKA